MFSFSVSYGQEKFSVIANDVGFEKSSPQEIKSVFKGKFTFWKNNKKVILVLPSSKNPISNEVASFYYQTTTDGVKKYWLSLVFQGRSTSPVFLDSDKEVYEFIQKNEGAIGLISTEFLKNVEEKYKLLIVKQ